MDIFEIRKANLIRLIGSRRKGACADKWEMAPAHLSQVLSNKTAKNLGEDVARRIEQKEGLPHGWLDTLQGEQPTKRPAVAGEKQAVEAVGEQAATYQQAKTKTQAEAAAAMLEAVAALHTIQAGLFSGQLTEAQVEQIMRLRNDIVHRPASAKDQRLQGLLASAFKADENGGSPDDLLKMYQRGMEKDFAKEGAEDREPGKKPARRT